MSIVGYENSFKVFVRLFQKYPGRQDIIVRLGYVLGNLMASSDVARTKVRMYLYCFITSFSFNGYSTGIMGYSFNSALYLLLLCSLLLLCCGTFSLQNTLLATIHISSSLSHC